MIIDIKPEIRLATDIEKICMELYGDKCRYVVLRSDGTEESVHFSEKALDEFCSGKKVSEMLKEWKKAVLLTMLKYKDAIKTNIHPYWTHTAKTMVEYPQYKGTPELQFRWNGNYHEAPLEMTRGQKRFFQSEIERLSKISGEYRFIKIVLKYPPKEFNPDRFFAHQVYDMIAEVVGK